MRHNRADNQNRAPLRAIVLIGLAVVLTCPALTGCKQLVGESSDDSANGSSASGGDGKHALSLPSSFFPDIPLPDGAVLTAVRTDEFGDPEVEFAIPSPAQPLNAWYTIESSKKDWMQIGSTERLDGGGTGTFAHRSEDRFFQLEIKPNGEQAIVIICYRGAGI